MIYNIMQIDPNIEYETAYHGKYHIIKDLGYYEDGQRKVLIKFNDTGNEQEARLYRAIRGQVRDRKRLEFHKGEIRSSNNYGDFEILAVLGSNGTDHNQVEIKFLQTGYKTIVSAGDIRSGTIKDPYYPSVCGVGCIGEGMSSSDDGYNVWHDMIRRCYDKNDRNYKMYGGAGVIVCNRWLCFENFYHDLPSIPGYIHWIRDNSNYQLDKDTLQQGIPKYNKIYSPETCCFITRKENMYQVQLDISRESFYSKYAGVVKPSHYKENDKRYKVEVWVNGTSIGIGTYDDEIAAANAYNSANRFYNGKTAYQNQVQYMNPIEVASHRTTKKNMIKIVKDMKD